MLRHGIQYRRSRPRSVACSRQTCSLRHELGPSVMLRVMAESITVTIADLRSALSRALDATEAQLGPDVSLAVDHYWHLPVEDAFNLSSEPGTFTVGQVSDDLDEVVHIDRNELPEGVWHNLGHLVGVLRALEYASKS